MRPSLIGQPGHKGGNLRFERLLFDVRARLLGDKTSYCSTFFDYYGLSGDFPGKAQARTKTDFRDKSACLLYALSEELKAKLGEEPFRRLIRHPDPARDAAVTADTVKKRRLFISLLLKHETNFISPGYTVLPGNDAWNTEKKIRQ